MINRFIDEYRTIKTTPRYSRESLRQEDKVFVDVMDLINKESNLLRLLFSIGDKLNAIRMFYEMRYFYIMSSKYLVPMIYFLASRYISDGFNDEEEKEIAYMYRALVFVKDGDILTDLLFDISTNSDYEGSFHGKKCIDVAILNDVYTAGEECPEETDFDFRVRELDFENLIGQAPRIANSYPFLDKFTIQREANFAHEALMSELIGRFINKRI